MILTLALLAALALPDSVCVTEHGSCYHKPGAFHCAGVTVTRSDAEQAGFSPCKPCFALRKAKLKPYDRLRGKV